MRKQHRSVSRTSRATLLVLILCSLVLAVAACGNKNRRSDKLVSDKDPVRGFLATIPSDTPYAFVAAEPMPLGPMVSWMEGWYSSMESMLPDFDAMLADEYVNAETKLIYATFSELKGNYSAEGLKKLGFSMSPRFAFFGIGVLPAFRVDLDDADAFRATRDRVEKKAGYTAQAQTLGAQEYRSYSLGGDGRLVMAVMNRQLVWGVTEASVAPLYTEYLLGAKQPPTSMADDDKITAVAKKHGFKRYGAGFVDFERLAQLVFEPGTSMHDEIQAQLMTERPETPPGCLAETKRLIATAPRAVFGYEELSANRMTGSAGLELSSDLGERLGAAKQPTPLIETDTAIAAPFSAAFGFDVGAVLNIVSAEAASVQQSPFQCPWYVELNSLADEASMLAAKMPALVTNLKGAGVIVQHVESIAPQPPAPTLPHSHPPGVQPQPMTQGPTFQVKGIGVVNSANPNALLAFLRTFAQEFENVTPDPGGIPFKLPPSEMLNMFVEPHVILTPTSLALASGAAMTDESMRLVTSASSADAPFFAVAYDLKKIWELQPMPGNQFIEMMAIGRTELSIEPRDHGVFMGFDIAKPMPR